MSSSLAWRKSSHSQGGGTDCVEVAATNHGRAVRDSKDTSGPIITLDSTTWRRLLEHVKRGDLDL
ncbi:DUF397 domain-containing protein [Spirillospora sp. NPDC052269]